MQGNTGECRGMQRDAEECSREMQRNAKGYKGGVHMEEDRKVSLSDGEWRIMNAPDHHGACKGPEKGYGMEQAHGHYHAEPAGGKVGRVP